MMELPEREEDQTFLNDRKQKVYDWFYDNPKNLYNEKYITDMFFEKLLLNYEKKLTDATSTSEIKKIENSFIKVYDDLRDNPIKRTPGIKKQEPPDYQLNYTIHEPETVRFYEEVEKIIPEGINTLLHQN